ncbi:MAG TPA: helix-turn-helix transcriptional regulator [Ktedonobacterales bacterium]|jgi:transcriptional regulator with XRE-family HTH domain
MQDLFELRRSKGKEQQEVAAQMGLHKATLSQIERGRTDLTLARAEQYAAIIGVTLLEVAQAAAESRKRWQDRQNNPKATRPRRRRAKDQKPSPDPQTIPDAA